MNDNISNLFQLTEEDKDQYRKLIDKIDLDTSDDVISMLKAKLDKLISSDRLNDIEINLIKNVSVLVSIYQTYPDLTASIRKKILFAYLIFAMRMMIYQTLYLRLDILTTLL